MKQRKGCNPGAHTDQQTSFPSFAGTANSHGCPITVGLTDGCEERAGSNKGRTVRNTKRRRKRDSRDVSYWVFCRFVSKNGLAHDERPRTIHDNVAEKDRCQR
jgi:hypothetical protein